MGLYNVVRGRLTCPRCGRDVEVDVETRLGYVHEVLTLRVGERYPWNHPEMPPSRPEGGNAVGDGYGECRRVARTSSCGSWSRPTSFGGWSPVGPG
jgi:hypothetical protein